ncbi:hypothetical protein F4556_007031 [Kitasatospora gansuensis]|uniref:Peptidase inhibitor family I36 n=1 Tax=Kitasatospora gansuensis TaxID=258050 RepID=A0A7W7WLI5_9ACTN|nr:peptidase inhibitor family I36 protein [Kitasatospora gansuensis]MBB4951496.1 hypothetical protein [Kitasatospora gansuensis]
MRLRNLAAAALLAAAATATGVGAGTASADSDCPTEYACMYSDAGYEGFKRVDFYSQKSWRNVTYDGTGIPLYRGDGVPTNVSSMQNRDTAKYVAVYYNSNQTGPCFSIASFAGVYDFSWIGLSNGLAANDNMNSYLFTYKSCGTVYTDW